MSGDERTHPVEFVLFQTSCGCVKWERWMPELYGPEVYVPMEPPTAGVPDDELKARKFRSEGVFRMQHTSGGSYLLYTEVVE